jgi:acetylornithine deacetylase/succinyl-diaminopimelate desuccinylase-like protein
VIERFVVDPAAVRDHPEYVDPGPIVPAPNVLGRLPGGAGGRSLLILGHVDTEPVHDPSRWQSDPFRARLV